MLKLAEELHRSSAPEAKRWAQNLQPLADALVQRYLDFLPKQTYPIRTGLHPNTAFGLAFALDYANTRRPHRAEANSWSQRSLDYFGGDTDYPAKLEPNGSDFLSPALVEADLMRRVLPPAAFAEWFRNYLPRLNRGEPKNLLEIAVVTDRSDPQLGHLDGLNLSRAWCMRHVAAALPEGDPARAVLAAAGADARARRAAARRHRPLRRRALAGVVRGVSADGEAVTTAALPPSRRGRYVLGV